ncbi:amidinotransferase [Clostridium sp. 'deep sea']|uniref:dimethylarginine dimethylaminohydrolase family protein n=1 Tax=Clostridium sp. 'deep sea' TaxID=2779445 RepID=UPI0018969103|nr:arginine deiminase family protein [Clostridium sp. 'deep sea']QOR33624.1 amidinotransferase [Clostridium sp. 'deep sea']
MNNIDIVFLNKKKLPINDTSFVDDMKYLWGDWGVNSEVSPLKSVLLRRPGKELEQFNHEQARFKSPIIPELFRVEHDVLADIYRNNEVEVHYVENMRRDRPNSVFLRDLMFMTPEGAILGRSIMPDRRGEERYIAEQLAKLGVPILCTINGNGFFEGSNAMWVNKNTVIIASNERSNEKGLKQVKYQLRRIGVKNFINLQLHKGLSHIDQIMNFISEDMVAVFKPAIPVEVEVALKSKGYKLLEAPCQLEIQKNLGLDFVTLEPGKIIQPSGNPRCKELFENNGIEVITAQYSEMIKGLGGINSVTAVLKRE